MWIGIKTLLIFLVPSIVLGVIVGLYPGYRAYKYAWQDDRFCYSCHVHDYATIGWKKSIHGDVTTCHDCHHQPLRAYVNEAWLMIKRPPKFPRDLHHTPYVKKDLCAACHISNNANPSTITGPMASEDIAKIPKVDLSLLHKLHLSKETDYALLNSMELSKEERDPQNPRPPKVLDTKKGAKRLIVCADCHGGPLNRAHNFSAVDATCVRCHEAPHKTMVGQEFGCRNCHFPGFLIPADQKTKEH